MEEFRIVKNLTVLEVVPLCITETLFEVVLDSDQRRILACIHLSLDLVQSDRLLNDGVIVGVHASVWETKKIDGKGAAAGEIMEDEQAGGGVAADKTGHR